MAKFVDVSAYQDSSAKFFAGLIWSHGIKGAVVKLTEGSASGSNYINPVAGSQIANAKQSGLVVSAYHYARYISPADARAEAEFFVSVAKQFGLGSGTTMVVDVEDQSIRQTSASTAAFVSRLHELGYTWTVVYTMASWLWSGALQTNQPLWVANYGVSQPGVTNVSAWQYQGSPIDLSIDYGGLFTTTGKTEKPKEEESMTLPKIAIPVMAAGVAVVDGGDAPVYTDSTLSKLSGKKLKHGTAWKVAEIKGGAINVGGWLDGRDVAIKINPVVNNVSNGGIVKVVADNAYTQAKPAAGETGIKHLAKGTSWTMFGRSADGKFVNVGGNQWVDAGKVNLVV